MAAHSARAQPTFDIALQNCIVLVRMTPAAVNHAHTRETCAKRLEQKLFESESGILDIQTMKIEMCLNRESAGSEIV